jgi:hypothetical protein
MTTRWPAPRFSTLVRTYGLAAALGAVFLLLVLRNTGLYPSVFADEWSYSSNARLLPFEKSLVPSYLYLGLFRLTNSCGNGFLECTRILNALLFVAAAPFLYLTAKKVCSTRVAALIALLSVLGPVNVFTAYFMPEPMYFFGFAVFAWAALEFRQARPLAYGLLTGTILGLMSGVKVHALFLMPPLLVFMLYLSLGDADQRRGWLGRLLQMALAAVLAMAAVKLVVGYLFAGRAGLNILGSFYTAQASGNMTGRSAFGLLPDALISLQGHLMALAVLMSLPLAMLALHTVHGATRRAASADLRALQVFSFLVLGALLAVTALFTATTALPGGLEGMRLHVRYYDFVFPLLLVVAGSALAAPEPKLPLAKTALVALPLAALALYAGAALLPAYSSSLIDGPELGALILHKSNFQAAAALAAALLVLWIFRSRLALRLFMFVLLPLTVLYGMAAAGAVLQRARVALPYDKAGIMAHHYLSREDTSKLTVAGEGAGLWRAMFHIDNPDALIFELPNGTPLAREELSPRQRWMLVVGDHPLPADVVPEIRTADYALIRTGANFRPVATIAPNKPLPSGVLERAEGLAEPEPWGAWSNAAQVKLHLNQPLPKKLALLFRANAFGPNTAKDFVLTIGDQRKTFRLAWPVQDRYFEFDTDGTEQLITIDVPQPTSPLSVNQGGDERLLGIGITSIEIGERP